MKNLRLELRLRLSSISNRLQLFDFVISNEVVVNDELVQRRFIQTQIAKKQSKRCRQAFPFISPRQKLKMQVVFLKTHTIDNHKWHFCNTSVFSRGLQYQPFINLRISVSKSNYFSFLLEQTKTSIAFKSFTILRISLVSLKEGKITIRLHHYMFHLNVVE